MHDLTVLFYILLLASWGLSIFFYLIREKEDAIYHLLTAVLIAVIFLILSSGK